MTRRLRRADEGSSLVEFALIAPVLIFLLIGLIEVSRYTYFGILAAHAARAGVQYGAQNAVSAIDDAGVQNAVAQDAQNLPNWHVTRTTICTVNGAPTTCPQNSNGALPANLVYFVQVQVTSTLNSLLNYPGIPTNIPVSATATMRVGNQ